MGTTKLKIKRMSRCPSFGRGMKARRWTRTFSIRQQNVLGNDCICVISSALLRRGSNKTMKLCRRRNVRSANDEREADASVDGK